MASRKKGAAVVRPLHHPVFSPSALYNVEQASEALLVSQRTLRRWIADETLPSVRITAGRAVRLRGADLNALLSDFEEDA